MRPEELTVLKVEKAIGVEAEDWKGNCFGIASMIVDRGLVDGVAVYGHYLGPIAETSMFYCRGVPFTRHGWVVLKDGRVLDPTRWVFEDAQPSLYLGPPSEEYDEGGNRWRLAELSIPPKHETAGKQIELKAPRHVWAHIRKLLRDRAAGPSRLCYRQLVWLANCPLALLAEHAAAIYKAIEDVGEVALIPFDNKKRVDDGRW